MATILPSPDSASAPAAIPPVSSITPPQFSTPPQPSTSSPPVPSIFANQLDATPPDSSSLSPPSSPPNAPPPTTSETPIMSSPVDASPPPTTSAPPLPPPSQPASPPVPISAQPLPPSDPSPPPSPDVSPPPPPPVATPPPITEPPPNPPTSSPPPIPPPVATTPPPSSSPPPVSSPTPPSLNPPANPPPSPPPPSPSSSSDPPALSPPPPSSEPPVNSPPTPPSPPSPPSVPPKKSPSTPQSSPSAPAVETPATSPPSTTNPPSEPRPLTPPPIPSSVGPPIRGPETTVQSSPTLPAQDSSSRTANGSNGGIGSGGAAAIGVVAGVLMLGLIGFIALWIIKRKKRNNGTNDAYIIPASLGSSPRSDVKLVVKTGFPSPPFGGGSNSDTPSGHGGFGHSKPWFTYQELSEATGGFSDRNILGEGGFGYVYKGTLADGRVVAVKQLKTGGGQGEREFQAEVEIISRIHHRHLVSLVGYCIWESKRLLVYDYVPNNTLYFHLHGEGKPVMDWATRLKIATGSARGLAYLHEDCHPRVIHRDIKSSNILIDNNFEAQVADFGLARLAMDADTHVSTRVMGTFGYLAPEYATSGKLTEKSDVYSFGVVLLELITGRKPVDESQPLGDESLVEWARPLLSRVLETGEFEDLVDPRLEKNYIDSEMFRMIEAAAACVRHSSTKRPRMGQVVRALDGMSDSGDLSNGLRVGESRLYDPAQQSAEIRWFRRVAFGSQGISSEFFNQNLSNSFQSEISRQHSQSSQSMGFSRQSRQNADLSAGDISRPQQSNVDFFRQGQ